MVIISFRSRKEKEDMIAKARKMEEFASEFVDCLENSDEEYMYNERSHVDDGDMQYRNMKMRNRYSYRNY